MFNIGRSKSVRYRAPLGKEDVVFKKHPRARNYLARVDQEGRIVLTLPRYGSQRAALAFANTHRDWLEEQIAKSQKALKELPVLGIKCGDKIWYRGQHVVIKVEKDWGRPVAVFADQRIYLADEAMNLAVPIAKHLRELAKIEIVARVAQLAKSHGFKYSRVSIRDQKTRWGSCSTNGTISLSWRLILAPRATCDYVIFHELAHLKHFDHSSRFWSEVARLCPDYRVHETWLNMQQNALKW